MNAGDKAVLGLIRRRVLRFEVSGKAEPPPGGRGYNFKLFDFTIGLDLECGHRVTLRAREATKASAESRAKLIDYAGCPVCGPREAR